MKWVTRQNASVDRIACPWLVKRFIDPEAEFLYVPAPDVASVAPAPAVVPVATSVANEAPQDGGGDTDPELLDIFLEEADGVLVTIAETTPKSEANPDDGELLTELRRAFHTLKGSGRMVGLTYFGEAAWELEQVFNEINAGGVTVQADLYRMVYASHADFARWVAELRGNKSARIDAARLALWAQRYRAGEALPLDTPDKPVESHSQTPAPLPVLEMAEEPSLSMTLDIPAALSTPDVPASAAIEPPVKFNELNTLTLDFEPTPSIQSDLAPPTVEAPAEAPAEVSTPPVPDSVQVGEVSVSRDLYEVMLPEAREHAATLVTLSGGIRDEGKVTYEAMRAAHTLRGISASAKLPAIVTLAGSLERVLQAGVDSKAPLSVGARAIAARAAVALAAQIDDLAAPRTITPHDALCAELDALRLDVPIAPVNEAPPEVSADAAYSPPTEIELPASPASEVVLAEPEQGDSVNRRQYRLKDDIDPQLLPIFLEEANELVPQVGQDLRDWRSRPADKLAPQSLKRLLHTLKGSARMAGAMALGQLTHSMETRVENAELLPEIPPQLFDGLETSFDRIGVLIAQLQGDDSLSTSSAPSAFSAPAADVVAAITPNESFSPAMDEMSRSMHRAAATKILTPSEIAEAAQANAVDEAESASMTQTAVKRAAAAAGTAAPVAGGVVRPLIRVRADLIERLANQAGEISITRSRVAAELRSARNSLRELAENIVRLRGQLRELEIQAETQMQSRQQITTGEEGEHFDPLEFDRFTRLQELTRLMAESVNDVATVQRNLAHDLDEGDKALAAQAQIARDVQQDLMTIRMVQFSTLSDRLYRVARLSARENNKRVELEITGAHVEMDRSVIERVAAPIEHLLRNAIVHGIESQAAREASGKPEQGTLKLEARQEGNEVVLTLADDGAGLNIERIREKAIAQGLMRENQRLTEQQIGNFIFRSGFSTASSVTEDAGRGVGMDVVMSEITALGGRVGTTFKRGAGTTFTVHLPLTLSVLQAVVMRLASNFFAVPTAMVEQVQRLRSETMSAIQQTGHVDWQDKRYPFNPLGALLNMEADDDSPRYSSVLLLRAGAYRAAIQVDDIVGGQEIVIKNAGTQLARVPGVTGAAVLGSGETVLILNPVLLSQRALAEQERVAREMERTQGVRAAQPPKPVEKPAEPERQRSVLVVDDSLTVRKITSRLLTREGYIVLVAKDGIEALEKLREQVPDVMITDVEMPRMDGFDLTRNVRADEALKGLPVIMITSRTADKHREHANELGVDVFLGKPYEEGELLRHIATLAKRTAAI